VSNINQTKPFILLVDYAEACNELLQCPSQRHSAKVTQLYLSIDVEAVKICCNIRAFQNLLLLQKFVSVFAKLHCKS